MHKARLVRSAVSCLTAAAVLIAQAPSLRAQTPQPSMTRADYEACQAQDEVAFRRAIETITLKGLESGLAKLDYKPLVADEWRRERFDDVIDKQVDEAVGQVRDESTWMQLWSTLASRQKAQELATTVAERVYRSDALKQGIERIATGVGKEVARRIELAVIDTAGPAMQCMQAFLGRRFGTTVAAVVSADTGLQYSVDPAKGGAQITAEQILVEGKEGVAGVVVLVVRRQLSSMASRIGQRVVGAILSRLVATVAGVVGVILIAKDIWDFRHGVLPIVAEEMKSRATKDKVREEIATTIADTINQGLKEIASNTADRVVEIWLDFRRAHAQVLALAERNADFKRLLDTVRPADLARLDEVTALVLASEGEAGILKRLADGTLTLAVSNLPPAALDIAREARSLETALRWSAVAGDSSGQGGGARDPPPLHARCLHQGLLAAPPRARRPARRNPPRCPAADCPRFAVRAGDRLPRQARARPRRAAAREPRPLPDRPGEGLGAARAHRGRPVPRPHGRAGEPAHPRGHHHQHRPGGGRVDDAAGRLARPRSFRAAGAHQAGGRRARQPHPAVGEAWIRSGDGGRAGPDAPVDAQAAARGDEAPRHRAAGPRPLGSRLMRLLTCESIDQPVERGEIVYAVAVSGANILRDMREAVINTIGGRMTKYEALLDQTIARALDELAARARAKGYDGVLGIRILHPTITNGAIAVTVTGTGFELPGRLPSSST